MKHWFFDCIGGNRPIGNSPQDGPPKKQRYCRRTRGSRVSHQLPFLIISFQITAWGSYGACACREPAGGPGEPEQHEAEAPGTPDAEEECRPLDEVIGDFDYPSEGEEVEDIVSPLVRHKMRLISRRGRTLARIQRFTTLPHLPLAQLLSVRRLIRTAGPFTSPRTSRSLAHLSESSR